MHQKHNVMFSFLTTSAKYGAVFILSTITHQHRVTLVLHICYYRAVTETLLFRLSQSVSVSVSMCRGLCSGEECEACWNARPEVCFLRLRLLLKEILPFSISSHPPPPHLPPPSVLALSLSLSLSACVDSGGVLIQLPHAIIFLSLSHTHTLTGSSVSPLGDCLAGRQCRKKRDSRTKSLCEPVSHPLISAVLSASVFIASSRGIAAVCPAVTAAVHTLNLSSEKHVSWVIWITLPSKSQNPHKCGTRSDVETWFVWTAKLSRSLSQSWKQLSQSSDTVKIWTLCLVLISDRRLILFTFTKCHSKFLFCTLNSPNQQIKEKFRTDSMKHSSGKILNGKYLTSANAYSTRILKPWICLI